MIPLDELGKIADARLEDASTLFENQRYDGAIYLCGYAIELSLKEQICRTLNWTSFPDTRKEFEKLTTFKTHDLDILLRLSGVEQEIKTNYMLDWSIVATWDPNVRYKPIGSASEQDAKDMLASTINLTKIIGIKI